MPIVVKKAQKTLLNRVDQAYTGVREHLQHPPTPEGIVMADIILIAVTIAFFVICALYVQWCDRIIGPDDFGPDHGSESENPELEDVMA